LKVGGEIRNMEKLKVEIQKRFVLLLLFALLNVSSVSAATEEKKVFKISKLFTC
jgi:hypothetical protein